MNDDKSKDSHIAQDGNKALIKGYRPAQEGYKPRVERVTGGHQPNQKSNQEKSQLKSPPKKP